MLRLRRVRKHRELLIDMRDSLIEMVSQRANSVCISRRFIMLCHADLRLNKLYVFEPIDRRSGFCRSTKKKRKKKAGRDVLVNEDMIGQWLPLMHINRTFVRLLERSIGHLQILSVRWPMSDTKVSPCNCHVSAKIKTLFMEHWPKQQILTLERHVNLLTMTKYKVLTLLWSLA